MARKNSFIGNLIAVTATVATIGGICYIFRNKIKESDVYKKSADKLSDLRNKMCDNFSNDEDFYFDEDFDDDYEEELFSSNAKKNREYTSIIINAKEKTDSAEKQPIDDTIETSANDDSITKENYTDAETSLENDTTSDTQFENHAEKTPENMNEIFAEDIIPTISFDNTKSSKKPENTNSSEEVTGYENEGLSDVYEDPDVLADADKLDY